MKTKIMTKISRFFSGMLCRHSEKAVEGGALAVTEQFECCVMCGAITDVPVSTPIERRQNYEIGCGQLCSECSKKQKKAAELENALTTEKILLTVEQSRNKNE